MKLLKFGGKSLANGQGIENVISIITSKINANENIAVIVSARGKTTDDLELFLEAAKNGKDFTTPWNDFKKYQTAPCKKVNFNTEFQLLENIFNGVKLIKDYSTKTKDLVLAQGELLSSKLMTAILTNRGIKSIAVDSRNFLKTDSSFGSAKLLETISSKKTADFFNLLDKDSLPIITGFIASNEHNETTTLGRNGSNYSASIIANYLNVSEILSYTHINGIYTANPDKVKDARIIKNLTYTEANELASFGASILHPKTITPLAEKEIPLRILNTFHRDNCGTTISNSSVSNRIKSITVQNDSVLIHIEGKGMLGKSGIDGRIFNVLHLLQISVGIISQGSSETGIGFLIPKLYTDVVIAALKKEFSLEIFNKEISAIGAKNDISVITIVGQNVNNFFAVFHKLNKENVHIILINNNLNGNNISLVVKTEVADKTVDIIHSQIFASCETVL